MEENKATAKTEEKEFVTVDGAGRYKTPVQEIFIDNEGNTKEVVFEIVKPQNTQVYARAYANFQLKSDLYEFAGIVLPKMINKPAEARKVEFFEYDTTALFELTNLLIEIMGKPQENKSRKLNMTLR